MIRFLLAALSAALLLAVGAPAGRAEEISHAGLTAQEVVSWLQTKSVTSAIARDKLGEDYVRVPGEINWDLNLFDCDKATPAHCKSLQFSAGWSGTYVPEQANAWNRDWRYLKSYVSKDGKAIWVQYDVQLTDGMSYVELGEHLEKWRERVATFGDYIVPKKNK
jgi:hypothetical protein